MVIQPISKDADQRPPQRPKPADHNRNKHDGAEHKGHAREGAQNRARDHTGDTGKGGAHAEDAHEDQRHVMAPALRPCADS